MRASLAVALGALAGLSLATCAIGAPHLELLGRYDWRSTQPGFGGLSGLELNRDGLKLTAVSDDGVLYSARLSRDEADAVTGVALTSIIPLVTEAGTRSDGKEDRDLEGLADAPGGGFFASAEGDHRVLRYASAKATPRASSLAQAMPGMPRNRGFEALAIDPSGALVVLPEWSGGLTDPFPILRRCEKGQWHTIAALPRRSDFRPVGADYGPDGHLYVLSRAFNGIAFAIRIDRVLFEAGKAVKIQGLYSSHYGQFDNLEGLAVWSAPSGGIRMTAVSDDNFSIWQRTWLVDFALTE